MPGPKMREPLVKTAVVLTKRQKDRLNERGEEEKRSLSYYVRTAIDNTYPEGEGDTPEEAA